MFVSRRVTLAGVFFLVSAVLFLSACAVEELEPRFSHQGRLQDENGIAVPDGNYTFAYRLYHTASGGTAVHTQSQSVAVTNGLFNTTVGLNQDIDPDVFARPVYMEMSVNGEVLTPRQLLQGSPFAFSLVPGATIQGSVGITRTFQTYDNTGSALTVYNRDADAKGGNGATIVNSARATGSDRGEVAALNVIAAGTDGNTTSSEGSYGSRTQSEGYRGSYTKGAQDWFAAVFDSNAGILIQGGGTCTNCAVSYPSENVGDEAIQAGDFVAAAGVREDEVLRIPVLLVRKAVSADDAVIGIASGALSYTEPATDQYGMTTGGFDGADGPAAPGGYVSVVVQGLVKARLDSAPAPAIGQWLTLSGGDVTLASSEQPRIAQVMSEPLDGNLVWVMFNGR
jgi:hypothetical protein